MVLLHELLQREDIEIECSTCMLESGYLLTKRSFASTSIDATSKPGDGEGVAGWKESSCYNRAQPGKSDHDDVAIGERSELFLVTRVFEVKMSVYRERK